jgi:hypothetical protein
LLLSSCHRQHALDLGKARFVARTLSSKCVHDLLEFNALRVELVEGGFMARDLGFEKSEMPLDLFGGVLGGRRLIEEAISFTEPAQVTLELFEIAEGLVDYAGCGAHRSPSDFALPICWAALVAIDVPFAWVIRAVALVASAMNIGGHVFVTFDHDVGVLNVAAVALSPMNALLHRRWMITMRFNFNHVGSPL